MKTIISSKASTNQYLIFLFVIVTYNSYSQKLSSDELTYTLNHEDQRLQQEFVLGSGNLPFESERAEVAFSHPCVLTCPGNLTLTLDPGACDAVVNYTVNVAPGFPGETDCQTSVQTAGLPSGSHFPIGTTANWFEATNDQGVQSTCSFNVTVNPFPNPSSTLTCNGLIQDVINENCIYFLSADQVLEGGPYQCYNDYIVSVQGFGSGFGGISINCSARCQTLGVTVTDPSTGNSCSGHIAFDATAPTIQASSINFYNVSTDHLSLEWASGDGTSRVVKINTSNNFTSPQNETDPPGDSHYEGAGEQVVYNGTADNVTVTGLSPATTYWFRIFEAKECANGLLFNTSNATGNPKSQATSGNVNPSWIGIYVSDLNHSFGPTLLLEGTSTQVNLPPTVKICADGSKVTVVKYKNTNLSYNNSNIHFRIKSDPFGQNEDRYGVFASQDYYIHNDTIIARFTHPKYIKTNMLSWVSHDEIEVVYGVDTKLYSYPINFYRAPIVFVHGLWGSPETFLEMQTVFTDNNLYPPYESGLEYPNSPLLERVNYIATNGSSFFTNRGQVKYGIRQVLLNARNEKYSAGKVIIISHSMGGILSRLYLQGSWPNIPYNNDIIKLITINTPHFGTQTANWLWEYHPNLIQNLQEFFAEYLPWFDSPVGSNNGDINAIFDLKVDSDPIMYKLNIPVNSQNKVASVTIHTDAEPLIPVYSSIAIAVNALVPDYIFNGEVNDLIVPISSQKAGINIYNTLSAQWHVGSSGHTGIINGCINLLDENPRTSALFTNNGFQPGMLIPPPNFKENNSHEKRDANIFVHIISPSDNEEFNAGESVPIGLQLYGDIKRISVIIFGSSIEPITIDTQLVSSLVFTIPNDALGTLKLLVLAGDSITWYSDDMIQIEVKSNVLPDSVSIYPNKIISPLGSKNAINVFAHFGNSKIDITSSHNLAIRFDSAFLISLVPGLMQSKRVGVSNVIVQYGELKDTMDISSYDDPNYLISAFNYSRSNICSNDTIHFKQTSIGLPTQFLWTFPGAEPTFSTEPDPAIVYQNTGLYSVSLKTYFVNGVDSVTLDSFILVSPKPILSVISSDTTTFCQGDSVTLSTSFANSYQWSNGATSQDITVNSGGVYVVTITDENGCTAVSSPDSVNVNPNPIPEITPNGLTTFCRGGEVNLTSETETTYLWNTGDITQSIEVSASGDYSLFVTDSNGCTGYSDTLTVTVFDSIPADITSSDSTIFCAGDSVILSASLGSAYNWNTGETTPSILVKTAGKYLVTVIDSNGCSSKSDSVSIQVHDLPIVDLGSDTIVSPPFILNAGNPGSSFMWNTGETSQSITPDSSNWYSVTVTDIHGCKSIDSIHVDLITGIATLSETNHLRVYPNPNNGSFTLSGDISTPETLSLKVYNSFGQVVYTSGNEDVSGLFSKVIHMEKPVPGMYYIFVNLGTQTYSVKVIVFPG
ncbi:MAG: T9SS type A sorting domain-containing protein [Saprospiraceae bacterium]